MLKYRLITGPLLVLLFLGIIAVDSNLDGVKRSGFWSSAFHERDHLPRGIPLFIFAILVVVPLAAWELSRIFSAQSIASHPPLTAFAAILGVILCYSIPMDTEAITAIAI